MSERNQISVTVRSYIRPTAQINGFQVFKPFEFAISEGSSLNDLFDLLFAQGSINRKRVAFASINGEKQDSIDTIINAGDDIRIFNIVLGG